MLVRRKLAETVILKAVREQLDRTEHIRHLLERVEAKVAKLCAHIPETLRTKEAEFDSEERRLANFVDFIGEGRGRQALGKALVETERRLGALREELAGLRRGSEKVFQAPPVEWIQERLARTQEALERRTERSALLPRTLLGKIQLNPTKGEIGSPYYMARTTLDTLSLLAPPPGQEDGPEGGSSSLRWWRRFGPNPPARPMARSTRLVRGSCFHVERVRPPPAAPGAGLAATAMRAKHLFFQMNRYFQAPRLSSTPFQFLRKCLL